LEEKAHNYLPPMRFAKEGESNDGAALNYPNEVHDGNHRNGDEEKLMLLSEQERWVEQDAMQRKDDHQSCSSSVSSSSAASSSCVEEEYQQEEDEPDFVPYVTVEEETKEDFYETFKERREEEYHHQQVELENPSYYATVNRDVPQFVPPTHGNNPSSAQHTITTAKPSQQSNIPKMSLRNPSSIYLTPKTPPRGSSKNNNNNAHYDPNAYVLNEVLHWEKRIVQYDQRYVNIVAAALDEARGGVAWKVGQIVEVVPSALPGGMLGEEFKKNDGGVCGFDGGEEEILYVV